MNMTENTKNKIAFCWGCYSPLVGDRLRYCNPDCEMRKGTREAARETPVQEVWVYLNKGMLDLARGQGIEPRAFSAMIHTSHDLMGVALFDRDALETIGDNERNTYDAYWREIPQSIPVPNLEEAAVRELYDPIAMREEGLLGYLSDHYGIATERKVAAAIGEFTIREGKANPIELFNTL